MKQKNLKPGVVIEVKETILDGDGEKNMLKGMCLTVASNEPDGDAWCRDKYGNFWFVGLSTSSEITFGPSRHPRNFRIVSKPKKCKVNAGCWHIAFTQQDIALDIQCTFNKKDCTK